MDRIKHKPDSKSSFTSGRMSCHLINKIIKQVKESCFKVKLKPHKKYTELKLHIKYKEIEIPQKIRELNHPQINAQQNKTDIAYVAFCTDETNVN